MARISRPADCWMYTMSAVSAKPSSRMPEMYACSSTFTLADGSSTPSFTGMGTRSTSLRSSSFSSTRTTRLRNSAEREKRRSRSMSPSVGRSTELKVAMVVCAT